MTRNLAIIGLVLGNCALGRCDLLLNAGDVFTYKFDTIPFYFSVSPPQVLVANAHFGCALDPATFDRNSDVVRIEAFETSTNEPPFFSATALNAQPGWTVQSAPQPPQHWQDLQGVLRVTVVTGSVILQAIQFGAVRSRADGGYDAYNSPTIPVSLSTVQDTGFFRIVSTQQTQIVSFNAAGLLVWSNSVLNAPCQIQAKRTLDGAWTNSFPMSPLRTNGPLSQVRVPMSSVLQRWIVAFQSSVTLEQAEAFFDANKLIWEPLAWNSLRMAVISVPKGQPITPVQDNPDVRYVEPDSIVVAY